MEKVGRRPEGGDQKNLKEEEGSEHKIAAVGTMVKRRVHGKKGLKRRSKNKIERRSAP